MHNSKDTKISGFLTITLREMVQESKVKILLKNVTSKYSLIIFFSICQFLSHFPHGNG